MIKTIIDKNTGQELRCQFYNEISGNEISENEIMIDLLRTKNMQNPYFDFVKNEFYDKLIID